MIEYPNPHFEGSRCRPHQQKTGETVLYYPRWKRFISSFVLSVYLFINILIMLVFFAAWTSVYFIIKDKFPEGGIGTPQWFLVLAEGIVLGLTVDVIQWRILVQQVGRFFNRLENFKTEEKAERQLIKKLYFFDFLNYFLWFFLLSFVYVIPHIGDWLTDKLNSAFFGDTANCCFGLYLNKAAGQCQRVYEDNLFSCCPPQYAPLGQECFNNSNVFGSGASVSRTLHDCCPNSFLSSDPSKAPTCSPCNGFFSFDISDINLQFMMLTPIIATQFLNLVVNFVGPIIGRCMQARKERKEERRRAATKGRFRRRPSQDAHRNTIEEFRRSYNPGSDDPGAASLVPVVRRILHESRYDEYDTYYDYHLLSIQYGFVTMFSILWPPLSLVCMIHNGLKMRSDGYRLYFHSRRPMPKRANGIGQWYTCLKFQAYVAVVVNVALVCISTGAIDFFLPSCVEEISAKYKGDLSKYLMSPDFECLGITSRLVTAVLLEHFVVLIIAYIMHAIKDVPDWLQIIIDGKEKRAKEIVLERFD